MVTTIRHIKVCDKCHQEADTKLYHLGFHRKKRSMDLCQPCAGPMVELLAVKMPLPPRQLQVEDVPEHAKAG